MSSDVSVGRPIMKYSFTVVQPPEKALSAVERISSSVRFLLITSRSRWVPSSGAKVRPLRRSTLSRPASSSEKPSRDILVCSSSAQDNSLGSSSSSRV